MNSDHAEGHHARVKLDPGVMEAVSTSEIMTPQEALEDHRRKPYTEVVVYRYVRKRGKARNIYTVHEHAAILQLKGKPNYRRTFRVADWTGTPKTARALALRIADALYEGVAPEVGPNRKDGQV